MNDEIEPSEAVASPNTPIQRWSIWKKLLILPLFLAVGMELLCVWIIVEETIPPSPIINGAPDDSPRNAALILGFLVAVFYGGYAALVGFIRFLTISTARNHDIGAG